MLTTEKMWRWIADETERVQHAVFKGQYFSMMKISEDEVPLNSCYCCDYAMRITPIPVASVGEDFSTK